MITLVDKAISSITTQIIEKYHPDEIILFGSRARGTGRADSDIDLCIVINTTDKRRLAADIYYQIESPMPFDVVIYTPFEWAEASQNHGCLAQKISTEGVVLHGRQQVL